MSDQPAEQGLDPLVEEAQSHGYLTIDGDRITYHCAYNSNRLLSGGPFAMLPQLAWATQRR